MPYIKLEDRSRFKGSIEEVLSILNNGPENPYIKGEYFGFFVNRLARKFLGVQEGVDVSFNSSHFDASKKKTLTSVADSLSIIINRTDPINSAGDLNYCISAVLWGFMGAATGSTPARYGMRAYLKGILEAITQELKSSNAGNQGDITQSFRRNLIVRGILSDVIDEAYRRDTVNYEDAKKQENGDIWKDGSLLMPEGS